MQGYPLEQCRLRMFDAVKTLSLEPVADHLTTATLKELNVVVRVQGCQPRGWVPSTMLLSCHARGLPVALCCSRTAP